MHRGRGQPSDLYRLCRDGKDERVAGPVDPETCAPSEPNYLQVVSRRQGRKSGRPCRPRNLRAERAELFADLLICKILP